MAIISILATIGFIKYSAFIQHTKETKAIADMKQIAELIEEYKRALWEISREPEELKRGSVQRSVGESLSVRVHC